MTDTEKDPRIEEVDDDMPPLEPVAAEADVAEEAGEAGEGAKRASRAEGKARKAFAKLGLKSVPGVQKVVVKKGKQTYFVVQAPDVFQSPSNDNAFVFFGEPRQDDQASQLQQLAQMQAAGGLGGLGGEELDDENPPELVEAGEAGAEGEGEEGVNPKHIDLVLEQVSGVSRAQAAAALRKTSGDVVNAIMELSM